MGTPVLALLHRLHRRFSRVPVDASRQPAELYYAQIYLEHITRHLSELSDGLSILSAGCGTGRLAVPLASLGHQVTGIDYHHDSLRIAKQNLNTAGVQAQLIEADLVKALKDFNDKSFDAVTAIESLYVIKEYEEVMDHLVRIVRPGGLLFITHRPRYFYLARALTQGHYDDIPMICRDNDGELRKGMHRTYYHWETRSQIEQTYTSRGLTLLSLHGIGLCSGFESDPLTAVCDPGNLSAERQRVLRQVEDCDDDLVMAGRYVLAIVKKPG
ncbi:MAG: class I SAM-dependent methyltransferase [Phycisphaerales bacterium]